MQHQSEQQLSSHHQEEHQDKPASNHLIEDQPLLSSASASSSSSSMSSKSGSADEMEQGDDGSSNTIQRPLGLTGLQNLGNTCYMNAVLQALSNCPQLTSFMLHTYPFVPSPFALSPSLSCSSSGAGAGGTSPATGGLAKAYQSLIHDMWSIRRPDYIFPSRIAQSVKKVCPAFKGYSQHDAQEFLRCLLDQLHEELKVPVQGGDSGDDADGPVTKSDPNVDSVQYNGSNGHEKRNKKKRTHHRNCHHHNNSHNSHHIPPSASESDDLDDDYETCDSGLSWDSSRRSTSINGNFDVTIVNGGTSVDYRSDQAPDRPTDTCATVSSSEFCDCDSVISINPSVNEPESGIYSMISQTPSIAPSLQTQSAHQQSVVSSTTSTVSNRGTGTEKKSNNNTKYRSVISDIFDGKILSSVQCLTCDTVSTTRETFQDLSLSIPTREQLNFLRAQRAKQQQMLDPNAVPSVTSSGRSSPISVSSINSSTSQLPVVASQSYNWIWSWIEWFFSIFWGPTVALEDCLSAFFSADELKGDNMYSCQKCKKLRNGIKYSRVLELPDILCIHLKRFRHDLMYSTKISSQVTFPLEGLDMSPYVVTPEDLSSENGSTCCPIEPQVTTYDLVSVICHHGTPASGHYTAYCLNSQSDTWYEFDDQYVTAVDPHQVASCEAYVLFYRKSSDDVNQYY